MSRLFTLILLVSPAIPQLLLPHDIGGHGGHNGGGGYGGNHGGIGYGGVYVDDHGDGGFGGIQGGSGYGGGGYGGDQSGGASYSGREHQGGGGGYSGHEHRIGGHGGGDQGGGGYSGHERLIGGHGGGDQGGGGYSGRDVHGGGHGGGGHGGGDQGGGYSGRDVHGGGHGGGGHGGGGHSGGDQGGGGYSGRDVHGGGHGGGGHGGGDQGGGGYSGRDNHGGGHGGGYGGGGHKGGSYHPAPVCHPQTITKYKTIYKDRKAQVVNNVEVRKPKPHVKKIVETRYTTIRYPVFITQVIKPLLTQVETKVRPMFFTKTINRYTTVKFTVTGIGQVTITTVKFEKEYITRCNKKGYGHRRHDENYGLEAREVEVVVDNSPDSPSLKTYKTKDPGSLVSVPYDFSIGKYRESMASATAVGIEPTSTKAFKGKGRPSFGPLRSLRPQRSSPARPFGPPVTPRSTSPARGPELVGSYPESPGDDWSVPHPPLVRTAPVRFG